MSYFSQPWECIAELIGHSSWIYGVPITLDGQELASVSFDKILIWELETQELDRVLEGHTDTIFSLSLSPNGKLLASGSIDRTTKLWNIETGNLISTFAERKDPIYSVAFSSDGNLIASGGSAPYKSAKGKTRNIYLWDINTKELIHTFSGHEQRVNSLSFSPDNKTLASGGNDGTVRLWNLSSGEQLHLFEAHLTKVSTVSFAPDGKSLYSSGEDGVKVWNLETKELLHNFVKDSEFVSCFAISPSGQLLAVDMFEGIEIWDLKTNQKIHDLNFKSPVSINFSPDGKLLASGDVTAFSDAGGVVKVWRVPEAFHSDIEKDKKLKDERKKTIRAITQRRGQAKFRKKLLNAYDYRCCITECDVEVALQAAHIVPYRGDYTNHVTNGLLLRADIHTLFDLYLLSINPQTLRVEIAPQLAGSQYAEFADKSIFEPTSKDNRPSFDGLQWHYEEFRQKQNNC